MRTLLIPIWVDDVDYVRVTIAQTLTPAFQRRMRVLREHVRLLERTDVHFYGISIWRRASEYITIEGMEALGWVEGNDVYEDDGLVCVEKEDSDLQVIPELHFQFHIKHGPREYMTDYISWGEVLR